MDTTTPPQDPDPAASEKDPTHPSARPKKFRFKSNTSSRRTHPRTSSQEEKHARHRAHRAKRTKHTHPRSPSPDPVYTTSSRLSPGAAFRESLFDALGDDEGAAYWETVYGQPIHTYSVPQMRGPDGELEQMDEEEYAAYVRARMWERTREGMVEEEERLRGERARRNRRDKERRRERDEERDGFERAVEQSLARGRERKRGRAWGVVWRRYLESWGEVDRGGGGGGGEATKLRNLLFWPVESGKRRDVCREAVEEFMRHAPVPAGVDAEGVDSRDLLVATLKAERVRWHPDKIQQRYGVLGIDEAVMRSVTEVFQIVDELWGEMRGQS
ncbi:hypothetical protein P168DRAFT_257800 [Aspergillus campestris IBT 28561]|uniref:J domain-containing protein n=1 Tax=Aspergillus campestris (strain IBT 28561) TaxID=1392248 RepID=A0A2I1CUT6_ASPC2|nr:uncharacterized protein P168DRAFT_257800 [Aspergillus campestris IBT 28561]PKY01379.1 hypothetical protein P168DRAFT_257800 [Aspergillus campestris IBT 28561]